MAKNAQTSLRLPQQLRDRLRDQAERNHRTLSAEVAVMLEQHLDAPTAPKQQQGPNGFDFSYAAQGGRA